VKLRKNSVGEFNGTAFVEFKSAEEVKKAVSAEQICLEKSEQNLTALTIPDFKEKRKSGEIVEEAHKKKRKASEVDDKEDREYVRGLVLKFEGVGPGVTREELREVFGAYGPVAWVDFSRDDADGFIRFSLVGAAEKAVAELAAAKKELGGKAPKLSLLEGDAEKQFWEHVWTEQENRIKRIEEKKRQKRFGASKFKRKKRKNRDREDDGEDEGDEDGGAGGGSDRDADAAKNTKKIFASDDENVEDVNMEGDAGAKAGPTEAESIPAVGGAASASAAPAGGDSSNQAQDKSSASVPPEKSASTDEAKNTAAAGNVTEAAGGDAVQTKATGAPMKAGVPADEVALKHGAGGDAK